MASWRGAFSQRWLSYLLCVFFFFFFPGVLAARLGRGALSRLCPLMCVFSGRGAVQENLVGEAMFVGKHMLHFCSSCGLAVEIQPLNCQNPFFFGSCSPANVNQETWWYLWSACIWRAAPAFGLPFLKFQPWSRWSHSTHERCLAPSPRLSARMEGAEIARGVLPVARLARPFQLSHLLKTRENEE